MAKKQSFGQRLLRRPLLWAAAGVGLWGLLRHSSPAERQERADPDLIMTTPDHMDSTIKVLKTKFADQADDVLKNQEQHFIYTQPMTGVRTSAYSPQRLKSYDHQIDSYYAMARKNKKQAYNNLVYGLIAQHEGKKPKAYEDSEGHCTIGCGFLLFKPGNDKLREKAVTRIVGQPYKKIYKGDVSLNEKQMQALTLFALKDMEARLDKAVQKAGAAPARMHPVHRAVILSMLYQTPNFLARQPELTDGLLQKLCAKKAGKKQKDQALQKLNESYAALVLLHYDAEERQKGNKRLAYSYRACVNAGEVISEDMLAMQIHTGCRDQKNASLVVAGELPKGTTIQKLFENPLCQWDAKGKAEIVFPTYGVLFEQNGTDIIVHSIADKAYDYTQELPAKAMQSNPQEVIVQKLALK